MSLKEFDLTGKAAVVVGGGRGIGKAIALGLAESGADVLVAARTREQIELTCKEIERIGGEAIPVCADATKAQDMEEVMSVAVSKWGVLDILVNSAGVGIRKPIVPLPGYKPQWLAQQVDLSSPTTEKEWNNMIDANMTSIFLATRAAGPYMIKRGKGKIINITSVAAIKGFAYQVLYCTTKAAVSMYTRALALEWARYSINVNAIGPGYVDTEMTSMFLQNDAIKKAFIDSVPLKRLCAAREVALLAVFLASGASDYITGQTVFIDGGTSAG